MAAPAAPENDADVSNGALPARHKTHCCLPTLCLLARLQMHCNELALRSSC